jgi:hypothetical protein
VWAPDLRGFIKTDDGGELLVSFQRVLQWWVDVYVCVNDTVEFPPAIGAQPPERFRQGVRA